MEREQLISSASQPRRTVQSPARWADSSLNEIPETPPESGGAGGKLCGRMSDCIRALQVSIRPIITVVSGGNGSRRNNGGGPTVAEPLVAGRMGEREASSPGRNSFNPPRTRSGRESQPQGTISAVSGPEQHSAEKAPASPITVAGEQRMSASRPASGLASVPATGAEGLAVDHLAPGSGGVPEASTNDIIRAVENDRGMLHTTEQLSAVLERLAEYLPIRVEVELDERGPRGDTSSNCFLHHLCLQILGPVRTTPHSALLGLLEDILLEDCVPTSLRISSIHFADVSFSVEPAPGMQSTEEANNVVSFDALPIFGFTTTRVASGDVAENEKVKKECTERFCAFAKNMLECYSHTTSVRLTRCCFTPSDLGRWLKLPLLQLRRLYFEKCPLTAAHLDALIRLARATSRQSGRGQAFQRLEELQLSGSLTEESVAAVLSYFSDELLDGEFALVSLRLPSLWLRVAQSHPILERQPSLIVTST